MTKQASMPDRLIIDVKDLKVHFTLGGGLIASILRSKSRIVKAVDGISFQIRKGEILGFAGESGCGKTTTGLTLLRLYKPTHGEIQFNGQNIANIKQRAKIKEFRRHVQMVFQNPYETLNPRFNVYQTLNEMLIIHKIGDKNERRLRVYQALHNAGLIPPQNYLHKKPFELSGGERQRISIARAIVLEPELIVADEPVAMLDVSIRAEILNLLKSLATNTSVSIMFISHDLLSISYLCDRVAVMYMGVIVEIGNTWEVVQKPLHPYTKNLVSSIPILDPDITRARISSSFEPPDPIGYKSGCRFSYRCSFAMQICEENDPKLCEIEPNHWVACHLYNDAKRI